MMSSTANEIRKFESKYTKAPNECWNWKGAISAGYGYFSHCGATTSAHRYSYGLYIGAIPKGLSVLHRCNNTRCVNPKHLYAGTQKDNVRDSMVAGTHYQFTHEDCIKDTSSIVHIGENHPKAKLTNSDVICIKKMLRDRVKQWLIAWIYQVKQTTIAQINTGRTWKSIKI